jgi:hypothetical protein
LTVNYLFLSINKRQSTISELGKEEYLNELFFKALCSKFLEHPMSVRRLVVYLSVKNSADSSSVDSVTFLNIFFFLSFLFLVVACFYLAFLQ